MADNKFILQLKGEKIPKSVVEIKDDHLFAVRRDIPKTDDGNEGLRNDTNSSAVVAKAAQNWLLDGNSLTPSDDVAFIDERAVTGDGLWVNAAYQFPTSGNPTNPIVAIINAHSKWVLRLVGKDILSPNDKIGFTLVVKIGTENIASYDFTVQRQAGFFAKKFVVDFSQDELDVVKINGGDIMTVQLLCNDVDASATIYDGNSVFTLLQRRVDGEAVANDEKSFDDVVQDIYEIQGDIIEIREDIAVIQSHIGDMNLPNINGEVPEDLSSAVRMLNEQNLIISEDSVSPVTGTFTLWGAINKALNNIANLFTRTAAIENNTIASVTPDNQAPTAGTWSLWGAIQKLFNNTAYAFSSISNIFLRLNAVEGVGGVLAPYDFGKSFPNPIDNDADIQTLLTKFITEIWTGATDIVFNTSDYAQTTFNDSDGNPHTAAEIFNATKIINEFDNTQIMLNNTQNTVPTVFQFSNQGVSLVAIANETTAGIVRAGTDSQIVVDPATGDVALDAAKATGIRTTISAMDRRGAEMADDLSSGEKTTFLGKVGAMGRRLAELVSDLTQPEQNTIKTKLGIADAGVTDLGELTADLVDFYPGNVFQGVTIIAGVNYLVTQSISDAGDAQSSSPSGIPNDINNATTTNWGIGAYNLRYLPQNPDGSAGIVEVTNLQTGQVAKGFKTDHETWAVQDTNATVGVRLFRFWIDGSVYASGLSGTNYNNGSFTENNWYHKYKSGWVEQGGCLCVNVAANADLPNHIISLPVTMIDDNYHTNYSRSERFLLIGLTVIDAATIQIGGRNQYNGIVPSKVYWEVKGMAAS